MKWLIGLLTAATGLLHIAVGFGLLAGGGAPPTNWLLVLNGVGYLVLLVLFWTSGSRGGLIRWILLAYTLITLIGYFVIGAGFAGGTWPLVIKGIELLLAILLVLYRVPETTVAPAAVTTAATRTGTTVTTAAANTAAGLTTAAGAAAVTAAAYDDRAEAAAYDAADTMEETWDTVEARPGEAFDATIDTTADTASAVSESMEAEAYAAAAGVAAVGEAWETGTEETGEAFVDTTEDLDDRVEAAWDETIDTAGDAVDATGVALAGAAAAVADVFDGDEGEAAMAEPTAAELRAELEAYLRSFGSGSEFRKGVEYIEGIGPAYGSKLRAAGVITVLDLMVEGATRRGRKQLADRSGLAASQILTWVNHVDLFRIKGVAEEYADLLEQSGVDTVVELAQRNPNNLFKRMIDINEQKALVRRTPHLSDVQSWVEQAKSLKRLVHY